MTDAARAETERIERDRKRRERELLALLLLFLDEARRHAGHALELGLSPAFAAQKVLLGDVAQRLPGLAPDTSVRMASSHVAASNRMRRAAGVKADPTPEVKLARVYREQADGYAQAINDAVRDTLNQAQQRWDETGTPTQQRIKELPGVFDTAGKTARLEQVATDAILNGDAGGAWAGGNNPEVKPKIKGYRHVSILDSGTTPICKARHDIALPADDPYWRRNWPMLHYGCRSIVLPITKDFEVKPPPAGLPAPAPGFGLAPFVTGLVASPTLLSRHSETLTMPSVKPGESRNDYMKRCVPVMLSEGKSQDQAVAACIHMHETNYQDKGEKKELSLSSAYGNTLDLARAPRLATCPHCGSTYIKREAGGEHNGPLDRCLTCGRTFAHKPGTITNRQLQQRPNPANVDEPDPANTQGHEAQTQDFEDPNDLRRVDPPFRHETTQRGAEEVLPMPTLLSRAGMAITLSNRDDGNGHWVTIGSREGEEGDRHGGAHVFIHDGVIEKGPKKFTGRKVSDLKSRHGTGKNMERVRAKLHDLNEGKSAPEHKSPEPKSEPKRSQYSPVELASEYGKVTAAHAEREKAKAATKITAYHGTDADFDKFDESKIGTTTDAGLLGHGFYFSTDKNIGRSNKFTKQATLSVRNPLELKAENWNVDKKSLVTKALGLTSDATSKEITEAAKAKGHDAVTLDYSPTGYNHKEIAVFHSSQIETEPTAKPTEKPTEAKPPEPSLREKRQARMRELVKSGKSTTEAAGIAGREFPDPDAHAPKVRPAHPASSIGSSTPARTAASEPTTPRTKAKDSTQRVLEKRKAQQATEAEGKQKRYQLLVHRPGQTHGEPLASYDSDDRADLERIANKQDSDLHTKLIDRETGENSNPRAAKPEMQSNAGKEAEAKAEKPAEKPKATVGKVALTEDLARAIGTDAGNASMKAGGRTAWNEDDYNDAAKKTNEMLDKAGVPGSEANPIRVSSPAIERTTDTMHKKADEVAAGEKEEPQATEAPKAEATKPAEPPAEMRSRAGQSAAAKYSGPKASASKSISEKQHKYAMHLLEKKGYGSRYMGSAFKDLGASMRQRSGSVADWLRSMNSAEASELIDKLHAMPDRGGTAKSSGRASPRAGSSHTGRSQSSSYTPAHAAYDDMMSTNPRRFIRENRPF